jgi:hypothetical protein
MIIPCFKPVLPMTGMPARCHIHDPSRPNKRLVSRLSHCASPRFRQPFPTDWHLCIRNHYGLTSSKLQKGEDASQVGGPVLHVCSSRTISVPSSDLPRARDGFNRGFKFEKRSQFFSRTHNQTLSVATMCIRNPDRSPVRIHGRGNSSRRDRWKIADAQS